MVHSIKRPADFHFESVRLVVLNSNRQIRQAQVSHLFQHGFRDITDTDRLSEVADRLKGDGADLLIASIHDNADYSAAALLRQLRHNEIGKNPFLVATFLTANAAVDSVRALMDSGPDAILATPVSVGEIFSRVMGLVQKRKPFVVTSEYIGPDRRSQNGRDGSEKVPLIDVPNPLRAKATGQSMGELANHIRDVTQTITKLRIERAARQIQFVGNRLPTLSLNQADRPAVVADFDRMTAALVLFRRLIPDTPFQAIEPAAARLAGALEALGNDPTLGTIGARKNIESLAQTIYGKVESLHRQMPAGAPGFIAPWRIFPDTSIRRRSVATVISHRYTCLGKR